MAKKHNTSLDSAEMYDEDVKRIGVIWQEVQQQFARKPNSRAVLEEMEKVAIDKFEKMGYHIRVHISESLMGVGPPTIEVIGRVAGHEYDKFGLDHEKKGFEVNRAVERNEDKDVRRLIKAIEPGKKVGGK